MTLFAYCTYLVIPVNVSGHMFLLVVYMFLCICEFVCISECTCVSLYVYLRLYTYIYLRLYTHVDKFSYIFIKTILIFKRKRIRKHTQIQELPGHLQHTSTTFKVPQIFLHPLPHYTNQTALSFTRPAIATSTWLHRTGRGNIST